MFLVRHIVFCEDLRWSRQDLKREEERREAEKSTRMAAEEQRQKDVSEERERESFVLTSLDWRAPSCLVILQGPAAMLCIRT